MKAGGSEGPSGPG